jgi:hypothetical protein
MAYVTSQPRPIAIAPAEIIDQSQSFQPTRGIWVQLRDLPSPYSHDRAILVCEVEDGQWLAWAPDHGQIQLTRSQFHQIMR